MHPTRADDRCYALKSRDVTADKESADCQKARKPIPKPTRFTTGDGNFNKTRAPPRATFYRITKPVSIRCTIDEILRINTTWVSGSTALPTGSILLFRRHAYYCMKAPLGSLLLPRKLAYRRRAEHPLSACHW